MAYIEQTPNAPESTLHPNPTESNTNPRKRLKSKTSKNQLISSFSIRNPTWSYTQLQHLQNNSTKPTQPLDGVTAHLHLTAALSTFLGLHGSAIPIDILKLENQDVWIRVPAADRAALIAAVGGWTNGSGNAWRVKGWSHWDANAFGKQDLFDDLRDL